MVYDDNSESSNELNTKDSFAFILLQKLVKNFNSVFLLTGGFKNFFTKYQKLCESTNVETNFFSLNFASNNYNNNILYNSSKNLSLNERNDNDVQNGNTDFQYNMYLSRKLDFNNEKIIKVIDHEDNEKIKLELRTPTKILDFLYLGSQEDALCELTMKVS